MNEFENNSFNNEQEYNPMSDFIQDESSQNAEQIIESLGNGRPENVEVATILDEVKTEKDANQAIEIISEAANPKSDESGTQAEISVDEHKTGPANMEEVPNSSVHATENASPEEQLDEIKSMFGEPNHAEEPHTAQVEASQQEVKNESDSNKVAELEASLHRLQKIIENTEANNSQSAKSLSHDNASILYAAGAAVGSSIMNLAHGVKNGAITVSENYSDTIINNIEGAASTIKAKVQQTMSADVFQRSTVDARVEKLSELKGHLYTSVGELKNSEYMQQYQEFVVKGADLASDSVKQTLESLSLKDDFQIPLQKVADIQEQLLTNIDKVTSLLKEDFDLGVNAMDSINKSLESVSKTLETVSEHIDIESIQKLTQSITELLGRLFPSANANGPKL